MFKNMLSAAAKKSTELNKEHLISEGILMIVAGTDTTAAALTFTIHHLLQQPEWYSRLQAEVKTVISTSETRPPFQDIDALPFLDACIKEGLRVSCPSRVRLPRVVPEGGWSFKGHYFPAGVCSISSFHAIWFCWYSDD
jgi:cytochrome P450